MASDLEKEIEVGVAESGTPVTDIVDAADEAAKEAAKEPVKETEEQTSKEEKIKMLEEATGVSEWIYEVVRKVCAD